MKNGLSHAGNVRLECCVDLTIASYLTFKFEEVSFVIENHHYIIANFGWSICLSDIFELFRFRDCGGIGCITTLNNISDTFFCTGDIGYGSLFGILDSKIYS